MAGVPESIIVPFVGVEFDPSRAQQGVGIMPFKALLIGQKTASGTVTADTLTQVFSAAEVAVLAGKNSMLYNMAKRWFLNNKFTDTYIVALDDAVGSEADIDLTIAGTATADGELAIYINGTRVAVPVAKDDAATAIGDAVVTAMANYDWLPWTATNLAGVVTFTAAHHGIAAGDGDFRLNDEPSDQTPAGVTASFGSITAGTVDPDVQDALDAIGSEWFNVIVNPYDDATNLEKVEVHLTTEFGPTIQKDGIAYQSQRDTVSNLITFATNAARNNPHVVLIDGGDRKCAKWELSAAVAAVSAASAQEDSAVPLHRQELLGIKTNSISQRRTLAERNNLAKNGVATLTDDLGVQTDATVTMYLKNSAGAVDTAYQQQNTMFQLQYMRWTFVNGVLSKFPRAKLMSDASRVEAGQQVITPVIGKAYAIEWFMALEVAGIVENLDQFKEEVICRRSTTNVNRLEWILPPDLVNQFIVGSGVMSFYL